MQSFADDMQRGGKPPRGGMKEEMNLTVLLIAAYLPLIPVLLLVLRSGAFGKGTKGTFLKLFFLGVAAAVPAFLMEAGGMLAATVLLRFIFPNAQGDGYLVISAVVRYVIMAALIEEAWKHFVLRSSTWKQMTMESIGDGTAASASVGAGFGAVMYIAWQAAYHVVPADMASLRSGMPDFLSAGAVIAFVYALLFIPAHFGYSGFMGVLYGMAKGSDQKNHSGRAGFMLTMSFLLPVLVHGISEGVIEYGISSGKILWYILGFLVEGVLAMIIAVVLGGARDAALAAKAEAAATAAANAAANSEGNGDSTGQVGSGEVYGIPYADSASESEESLSGEGSEPAAVDDDAQEEEYIDEVLEVTDEAEDQSKETGVNGETPDETPVGTEDETADKTDSGDEKTNDPLLFAIKNQRDF